VSGAAPEGVLAGTGPAAHPPAAAHAPAAAQVPAAPGKPVPEPTPETQPFWDGCAAGELRIQRCLDCRKPYFYPRPVCPACGSARVEWFTASGRATLYSYAIAVVQLAEGPRMMTSLTGVPSTPDDLILDMPLQVTFEQRGSVSLPLFTPAKQAR